MAVGDSAGSRVASLLAPPWNDEAERLPPLRRHRQIPRRPIDLRPRIPTPSHNGRTAGPRFLL